MEKFEYTLPTKMIFGKDTENRTAELIKAYGGHNVMIVYGGGSIKRSGLLDKICQQLDTAHLKYVTFGGVQPNPLVSFVNAAVKKAVEDNVDFVLAIGGGSVIDTTKAIAHGIKYPDHDIWDIWSQKITMDKTAPFGSILTLAAAGSETSDSSVLTNDKTHQKRGFSSPLNLPSFAIMNPELSFSAPVYQKACGAADIFMHTLERYFAKEQPNYLTDYIAEGVLQTVISQAPKMLADSTDYVAHSEIMYAGSVSHNGITGLGRGRDFSVHKFGHELSGKYNVTHGASLTAMWGSWARYVYRDDIARFVHLGKILFNIDKTGEDGALETITSLEKFFHDSLKLPISLSQLLGKTLTDEQIDELTTMCSTNNKLPIGCFHPLQEADIRTIYKMANH